MADVTAALQTKAISAKGVVVKGSAKAALMEAMLPMPTIQKVPNASPISSLVNDGVDVVVVVLLLAVDSIMSIGEGTCNDIDGEQKSSASKSGRGR